MFEKYAIRELVGYQKGSYGIRWNRDGEYLGAICGDRSVRIAQLTPGSGDNVEIIHTIPTSTTMSQLCWSPTESQRLALCSDDKLIDLWDIRASRAAMKMQSLGSNINMDWSPCGNYLAVGNKTDNICVLDVRTGNTCKKKKFYYEVNELAWTNNSEYILAAASADGFGAIDVISFQNGDDLEVADSIASHASNCFHLKIDPSFSKIGMSSSDQCLSIWNLETMISTHTFTLDSDIRNFSFSGDGQYISIICDEPFILICDCENGNALAKINTRVRNHMVAWNPKHSHIIASMHENRNSNTSQFLKLVLFSKHQFSSS